MTDNMSNIADLNAKIVRLESKEKDLYAKIGALVTLITKYVVRLNSFDEKALTKELMEAMR